ncbi:helix-turn-helix domain-containing protein [Secundilactobacillus odoratitofui]|uniref:helix-turn-helix domain-containing protein n=1 Tax=Secundilactobacillus odoratitofui TaxID=480930 RepID=UPI0006CF2CEB|nr:helix-turn-helix transcriptional regulator [Secundilactobacillus odoratitofui]
MFSERLRVLRRGQNLTLDQLAMALNELFKPDDDHLNTGAQIGNWERGIRIPSYMEVRKLAEFFDVTMDYLAGKAERDEYDLNRLFLSGKELRFDHQLLSSDDRYALYQLMDGYLHGKLRRTTAPEPDDTPITHQESLELDLGLDIDSTTTD